MHGEGDRLPGLVIDRYGDYFTLQTLDQGMERAKGEIVGVLEELFRPRGIVERNDVAIRKREALPLESGILSGEVPETIVVRMNGLQMHADLLHGQKTGIFLDQRENYVAAAQYARGRALDCFTSSGGFALHLAGRCDSVEAVDSAEATLRAARMNARPTGSGTSSCVRRMCSRYWRICEGRAALRYRGAGPARVCEIAHKA